MTPDRCEVCDRAECPRFALVGVPLPDDVHRAAADMLACDGRATGRVRRILEDHAEKMNAAKDDCHAHRVDWRARAVAAESDAERTKPGPASDSELNYLWSQTGGSVSESNRAVYNLGLAHGRDPRRARETMTEAVARLLAEEGRKR